MANVKDMTTSELRNLVAKLTAENDDVAKIVQTVDLSQLKKTTGASAADILVGKMTGLKTRRELMCVLDPEADALSETDPEYRRLSRNLSSTLNAIKKSLGNRLYKYKDQLCVLTEEELTQLEALHSSFGRKNTKVRKNN
jgi:hypothetical protein